MMGSWSKQPEFVKTIKNTTEKKWGGKNCEKKQITKEPGQYIKARTEREKPTNN